MRLKVVEYSELFLELSWTWLNDQEIKFLTDTPSFNKEDQVKWYNSLSSKSDYLIWGLMIDQLPIGVCGLKNITPVDCEFWGFIGDKQFWGKGYGAEMLNLMESKAIGLNMESMWLKVLPENIRAVKLYQKYGFKIEKESEKYFFMIKHLKS